MLRAIWADNVVHYQLVDIPLELLRLIRRVELSYVGGDGGDAAWVETSRQAMA